LYFCTFLLFINNKLIKYNIMANKIFKKGSKGSNKSGKSNRSTSNKRHGRDHGESHRMRTQKNSGRRTGGGKYK